MVFQGAKLIYTRHKSPTLVPRMELFLNFRALAFQRLYA